VYICLVTSYSLFGSICLMCSDAISVISIDARCLSWIPVSLERLSTLSKHLSVGSMFCQRFPGSVFVHVFRVLGAPK